MGRIVVSEFVSIDGVMEAPGGEPGYRHTNWVGERFAEPWFEYKLAEILAAEALLVGRVSYESFAGAWPEREGPAADKLNSMPKFVASTTMAKADWNNTTVLQGDALTAAGALKSQFAGDILVHGSRTLVNGLKSRGLVDEWRLMVFPVVLGSGARLFNEVEDALALKLVSSKSYGDVSVLTYSA